MPAVARSATYFSRQSSPRPVSVKTSPSIPLVWVSRCQIVMPSVSSSSLSFSSGMTSFTRVSSDSLPSSTSRMMTVAVHTFEIEPIWKTESFVTGAPVEMFLFRVP